MDKYLEILEAARCKYGLDTLIYWPSLWLLIPKENKQQLSILAK